LQAYPQHAHDPPIPRGLTVCVPDGSRGLNVNRAGASGRQCKSVFRPKNDVTVGLKLGILGLPGLARRPFQKLQMPETAKFVPSSTRKHWQSFKSASKYSLGTSDRFRDLALGRFLHEQRTRRQQQFRAEIVTAGRGAGLRPTRLQASIERPRCRRLHSKRPRR
jgi:hypothetical protein